VGSGPMVADAWAEGNAGVGARQELTGGSG